MYTIIGNCPKCGAPIYVPTIWHGITPPPSQRSCPCFSGVHTATSSNTTYVFDTSKKLTSTGL